ncbi:MAG: class I SAM-dependent methyltransferase [Planctomycetota bacterium]|jgi:SAM-dependent methyltransferase
MASIINDINSPFGLIFGLALAMLFLMLGLAIHEKDACGSEDDRKRWDERYDQDGYIAGKEPLVFLRDNIDLMPGGRALVLAMGEGRNAVFLAEQGLDVEGCDISPVAIEKAKKLAADRGVSIKAFEADLEDYTLARERYNLITDFYYLQRDLIPQIKAALKPGGIAIMETYTVANLELGLHGPRKREYLLEENELLRLFVDAGMKIIFYREMILNDERAIASIIAQKPE